MRIDGRGVRNGKFQNVWVAFLAGQFMKLIIHRRYFLLFLLFSHHNALGFAVCPLCIVLETWLVLLKFKCNIKHVLFSPLFKVDPAVTAP